MKSFGIQFHQKRDKHTKEKKVKIYPKNWTSKGKLIIFFMLYLFFLKIYLFSKIQRNVTPKNATSREKRDFLRGGGK